MSATYNWSIKSGQALSRGYAIDNLSMGVSADNVRPSGGVYVALFGNDTTGNGSRQLPYRTIAKACAIVGTSGIVVIASGVYREQFTGSTSSLTFVGDGDVVWDGTALSQAWVNGNNFINNIQMRNFQYMPSFYNALYFNFSNMQANPGYGNSRIYNCIFTNITGGVLTLPSSASPQNLFNCTFVNCSFIQIGGTTTYCNWQNIFYNCNIWFSNASYVTYSLFFQCNVRFNSSSGTTPTTLYPTTPTGYTQINSLSDLTTAHLAGYPSALVNFLNCSGSDPLFNNVNIGDYSIGFNSPAKNLAYSGTFVGARSISNQIKAAAIEVNGSFDFSSNVNLTVANDSITLVNPAIDAQIDTKCILNAIGRVLKSIPIYGFNADRNGQYIDSIPDLDTVTKSPTDTLTVPASYIVEVGSIIYNSNVYQPGDRFTTISGQTSFTTTASGVLREILEAPERHTVMMRGGNGGNVIASGTAFTVGNWYYVVSGTATYDSTAYAAGSVFKAIDTNSYTGTAVVLEALTTEVFNHFEPGTQPTTNNTGNVATGSILRGNGDPAYVRGGIGITEFAVNWMFIQIRFFIRVSNLKP
jgi:hypothetical protein